MSENINYAKGFRPKTWAKLMPFVRPYFRNLAIIIEVAAMNNRQKKMGYNAAAELLERLGMADDIPENMNADWDAY